ncbi:hypothetical protein [Streptomyces aurantiogriseus]|uniref:hypothetical protein n=1 Tax=Streptomyces aurantiogriseus TaxID=66870 RepID=UPI00167772A3|nr:hypothetical protein [Streptomyces aurantiogriseus]
MALGDGVTKGVTVLEHPRVGEVVQTHSTGCDEFRRDSGEQLLQGALTGLEQTVAVPPLGDR